MMPNVSCSEPCSWLKENQAIQLTIPCFLTLPPSVCSGAGHQLVVEPEKGTKPGRKRELQLVRCYHGIMCLEYQKLDIFFFMKTLRGPRGY